MDYEGEHAGKLGSIVLHIYDHKNRLKKMRLCRILVTRLGKFCCSSGYALTLPKQLNSGVNEVPKSHSVGNSCTLTRIQRGHVYIYAIEMQA